MNTEIQIYIKYTHIHTYAVFRLEGLKKKLGAWITSVLGSGVVHQACPVSMDGVLPRFQVSSSIGQGPVEKLMMMMVAFTDAVTAGTYIMLGC